jgi:hypothetical protein
MAYLSADAKREDRWHRGDELANPEFTDEDLREELRWRKKERDEDANSLHFTGYNLVCITRHIRRMRSSA